ncbi:MAG: hypothetical protein AUI10_09940 [Actinobacteria bacterium 13_2_20CM_2_72_6]|nr:MAG: hypothetical protein AUI10_09940 [Actinobacteria bacterium 13_2_20CM_2_72_6]
MRLVVNWLVASGSATMPKSMIRGPASSSRTLLGLRSRCTRPASWIDASASASPAASTSTAPGASGPCSTTHSRRLGPSTYVVASQGGSASVSASTIGAVNSGPTDRTAATSRANRRRNTGSSASSVRMTLIATRRPVGDRPR